MLEVFYGNVNYTKKILEVFYGKVNHTIKILEVFYGKVNCKNESFLTFFIHVLAPLS